MLRSSSGRVRRVGVCVLVAISNLKILSMDR